MNKKVLAVAVGAVCWSALVFAAGEMGMGESGMTSSPGFTALDADNSGYISQEEAMASDELVQNWSDVDANSDGVIDSSEFAAFEMQQQEGGMPMEEAPMGQPPMGEPEGAPGAGY